MRAAEESSLYMLSVNDMTAEFTRFPEIIKHINEFVLKEHERVRFSVKPCTITDLASSSIRQPRQIARVARLISWSFGVGVRCTLPWQIANDPARRQRIQEFSKLLPQVPVHEEEEALHQSRIKSMNSKFKQVNSTRAID